MITDRRSRSTSLAFAGLVALSVAACASEERSDCVRGENECPCTPLGDCDDGLTCHENTCLEPHVSSLRVTAAGVRACEALLRSGDSELAEVAFGSAARGAIARRGKQVGVSMISASDTDLTGTGVEVRWLGSGRHPDIEVISSTCFDRAGVEMSSAHVELR